MVGICYSSTWEVEEAGLQVQDQPRIHEPLKKMNKNKKAVHYFHGVCGGRGGVAWGDVYLNIKSCGLSNHIPVSFFSA